MSINLVPPGAASVAERDRGVRAAVRAPGGHPSIDRHRPESTALDEGIRRLAIAVLQRAIDDASDVGPRAALARAWLCGRSEALQHWCACAELSVDGLHRRLAQLLGPDLCPPGPQTPDPRHEAA